MIFGVPMLDIFLQDPVDPWEACPSPSWDITQYQINFQTESDVVTESVNIARCTAGRCSHTFEPPSNPPSSYDSVSVAAENVVGVGAERNLTTQAISELKFIVLHFGPVLYLCQGIVVFKDLFECQTRHQLSIPLNLDVIWTCVQSVAIVGG